jgi:SAM-dependent methyltransferase
MKNETIWTPSKFIYRKGKLIGSRNPREVAPGSRIMADAIAKHYDEYTKHHVRGSLLDLGCGKVPLYECYKQYISDNTCADWGNTLHKNAYLDCEHDLNTKLPFADEQFDTIILSDVLEHIYQPRLLWHEMHRVLKPNGKILMNVPFFYWLHEVPFDYYRYTEHTLRRFAEETHSKIHVLKPLGGVIEIWGDLMGKVFSRIFVIGKGLSTFSQLLMSTLSNTRLGKKIYEKTSSQFPFGYFMVVEKV